MTRKILDFVVIAILALCALFPTLLIGPPHKIGPIRGAIADFYDKIGVLDAYVNSKHKFGNIVAPFAYDNNLGGKASLVYLRTATEDEYRCQLILDNLDIMCLWTLTPKFWNSIVAKVSADDKDPIRSALLGTAIAHLDLNKKHGLIGRGVAVTKTPATK